MLEFETTKRKRKNPENMNLSIPNPEIESNKKNNNKKCLCFFFFFFLSETLAMVWTSRDINNTVKAGLDLKAPPTPLQNLLELLEANPRKLLLLGLHVLLIFLAKLHPPHPPPIITIKCTKQKAERRLSPPLQHKTSKPRPS